MNERIAYATLVGLVAYAAIATDLYLPALPAMVAEFGATEADGQVTLSMFMLGMAGGQLIFGPFSDYFGRLPVIVVGTLLFIATSVACALASSIELMWGARLVQGLAASSGPVIARAIVRDRYHGARAAQVMSVLGAAMAVVPLIAPQIGSWLLVFADWRATYLALAVFGLLILLGLKQFEETAPAIGKGGLGITRVLSLFSTCLKHPRFIGYQICGTSTYAAILAYLSTVSYFMIDVFDVAPAYFGYAFAISVSGYMVGALICSRLVTFIGTDNTLTIGISLTVVAALSQWLFAQALTPSVTALALSSFTLFFGIGLTSANASMGAVSLFPAFAGAASAVYGCVHAVIAAFTGYIAGQLYDGTLNPTTSIMLVTAMIGVLGVPLARGHFEPPSMSS